MLALDFKVDYRVKNTQRYFCGRMQRKMDTFCTSGHRSIKLRIYDQGRNDQITTSAKLLDITYESYGFSSDLIEIIN